MSNLDVILQNITSLSPEKEESRQKFASELAKYCNEVQGIVNSKSDDEEEVDEASTYTPSIIK